MIGIIADALTGGTFLSWSIHYLRGDTKYFLAETQQYYPLIENPLTNLNAHKFIPNQPNIGDSGRVPHWGLNKLFKILECLNNKGNTSKDIVYLHSFQDSEDNTSGIQHLCSQSDKTILISSKHYPLLHVSKIDRSGGRWNSSNQWITNVDLVHECFVEKYFSDSQKIWQKLNLTNVWDQREFLALNFKPDDFDFVEDYFDLNHEHYYLNVLEYFNFENSIKFLFDYLEETIDADRYLLWTGIYQLWHQKHQKQLLFIWYFDYIIDCIINGYSFDLKRLDLDLYQEAMIQRRLIYQHNLNLKTWQLEKFINTKQLHNLLEQNFHDLTTTQNTKNNDSV